MQKTIEKFSEMFGTESFLKFTVAATLAMYALNLLAKILCGLYSLFIADLMFFICVLFMYIAYKKHIKNVQKGLMGAILMWYLYDELSYVLQNIVFSETGFSAYNNFWGIGYIILGIATLVLFAALFVNHFLINGDHSSRPANVFINQLLVIVIAAISIISLVFQVFMFDQNFAASFEAVTWHLGLSALVFMIASYETRFDAYKIAREESNK